MWGLTGPRLLAMLLLTHLDRVCSSLSAESLSCQLFLVLDCLQTGQASQTRENFLHKLSVEVWLALPLPSNTISMANILVRTAPSLDLTLW